MNTPLRHRLNCTATRAIFLVASAVLSTLIGTAQAQLLPTLPATVDFTTATKGGGTNGTATNAPGIKKIAVDAVTGAPLTGPIPAGTTIKYVISYDPPGTGVVYPSVNITDTMSSGLTYVPGSLQMPPGWTSTPVLPFTPPPTTVFNGSQIGSEPGFSLPVSAAGVGNTSQGTGDGFTPVVVGDKVWSFSHHELDGRVNCYEKSTMAPCPAASFVAKSALPVGLGHLTFSRYAVHAGRIYYPAFKSAFSGHPNHSYIPTTSDQYGIGCYDTTTALKGPCAGSAAFTPLENFLVGDPIGVSSTSTTPYVGYAANLWSANKVMAGVVASAGISSNRIYAHVRGKVYCHTAPAMAPCGGSFPIVLPAYVSADPQLLRDIFVDNDSTPARLYVHNGRKRVYCFDVPTGTACAGTWPITLPSVDTRQAWISPTVSASSTQNGICISGAQYGGASPGISYCADNTGAAKPAVTTALSGAVGPWPYHGFPYRLPSLPNRVLFGDSGNSKARCVDYVGGTPATCAAPFAGSFANGARPAVTNSTSGATYVDYGYMAEPENPTCVYGLGDGQILFRFDAASGAAGCSQKSWAVPDPKLDFCDGMPHPIAWNAIRIVNRPANLSGGTITVKNGSTVLATMPVITMNSYSISAIAYASNPNITVVFNPVYSGAPPTTDYSLYVSFTSDVHPQICYKATTSCPVPDGYKNSVTFSQPATAAQQGFTYSDVSQLAASCGSNPPDVNASTCCPPVSHDIVAGMFDDNHSNTSTSYNEFLVPTAPATVNFVNGLASYLAYLKFVCPQVVDLRAEFFNGPVAPPVNPGSSGPTGYAGPLTGSSLTNPVATFTSSAWGLGVTTALNNALGVPGALNSAVRTPGIYYRTSVKITGVNAAGQPVNCGFDAIECAKGDSYAFVHNATAGMKVAPGSPALRTRTR